MSKKKKEKIRYIDDGRTIADMSALGGRRRDRVDPARPPRATFKEQWQTYIGAVKMMFVPMLVVICILIVLYMLFSFLSLIMY